MGTRADFYVGKGEQSEWLGSIAMDGYPDGIPDNLLACTNKEVYRDFVTVFLSRCDHATLPEMGWPWPWDDSRLTDFSYTFVNGEVKIVTLGKALSLKEYESYDFDAEPYIHHLKRELYFKDMSSVKNVNFGKRSGLIVIQAGKIVE